MPRKILFPVVSILLLIILAACAGPKADFKIDYEKYTLSNGLEVILHEDRSDPIAAFAIVYHVGSAREEVGRTGFAHLFEHMMFQESQHIPQDQFFQKIQKAGGTLNGGTSNDFTIYYEVVPKNALEMVLWMESDRMGFLQSTLTNEAFANQQEVVMNEKRQRVDNNPYGHTGYVIDKNLFPEGHPYNWQVIGSMEDLTNASLDDVRNFFKKWYGPNNATLVVAGDFDVAETKAWLEKYFGELKNSTDVPEQEVQNVQLSETKRVYHEDNFAKSPELNMVFPTVQEYHDDAYALEFLGDLLSDGKKAPLYKVIVEEEKLAPSVGAWQRSMEAAGKFNIRVRSFPGKNLTDVEKAIGKAFAKFEEEGFSAQDLNRLKIKMETGFYNGISSILNKGFQLALYNEYAGSPDYITKDLNRKLAVTREDIMRVYNTYVKDKPFVLSSFVPKGQTELVAENSVLYPVVEEASTQAARTASAEEAAEAVEKTPSSFDRTIEPAKGAQPEITLPKIWKSELSNGLRVVGTTNNEVPLVRFSLAIRGGLLLDDPEKVGVANLISDMLMEGTKNKTPIELEEAIDDIGATIRAYTGREKIVIQANTLASKFDDTVQLVEEILLEPRWDEKEFDRIKKETIEWINRDKANPNAIGGNVFNKLIYGEEHIASNPTYGTEESVSAITLDDLKAYYTANFAPNISHITIAGDISEAKAAEVFKSLEEKWNKLDVAIPEYNYAQQPEKAKVYFVDVPNAKQSYIKIGYLALPYTDADYYPCQVMNHKLGGSFNSVVNMILREEKGYTYGARTSFSGSKLPGSFNASSSVQSSYTLESVQIFEESMKNYRNGIADEDLQFTKDALIKSNARRLETLDALQGMLTRIADYDLPDDYIKQQEKVVQNMTLDQHKKLAEKYITPDKMIYLVVGDAATQVKRLRKLGFGKPVMLDTQGNRIN